MMTADVLEHMLVKRQISKTGLLLSGLVIAGGYLWRLTAVEGKLFRVNALALMVTGLCMTAVFSGMERKTADYL